MKIDRRSMLVCVAMAASFTFCNAFAHITNEASQGPDVGASGLGGDIMLLVVAEIMPDTDRGGSGTLYRRTIVHSGRRDAAPKTRPAIWPGRRGCPGGVAE